MARRKNKKPKTNNKNRVFIDSSDDDSVKAKEKEDLEAKIKEMQAEYKSKYGGSVDLTLDDEASGTESGKDYSEKRATDVDILHKGSLDASMKHEVWRRMQFVRGDDERDTFLTLWFEKSNLPIFHGKNAEKNIKKYVWVYSQCGMSQFNRHRSDIVGKIKGACDEWAQAHDCTLPTLEALELVINRDKKADLDVFAWWWDCVLPKVAGANSIWSEDVRYHTTISTYKDGKTPYITPGLEAFAYLTIANNHEKWPYVMKYKKENRISGKICIVESVDTDKNSTKHKDIEGKRHYIGCDKHPALKVKYTEPSKGQIPYRGYKDEGLQLFSDIKASCAKGRRENADIEKKVLAKLRALNNIVDKSAPKAAKKTAPATAKKFDNLAWNSDDEE